MFSGLLVLRTGGEDAAVAFVGLPILFPVPKLAEFPFTSTLDFPDTEIPLLELVLVPGTGADGAGAGAVAAAVGAGAADGVAGAVGGACGATAGATAATGVDAIGPAAPEPGGFSAGIVAAG